MRFAIDLFLLLKSIRLSIFFHVYTRIEFVQIHEKKFLNKKTVIQRSDSMRAY